MRATCRDCQEPLTPRNMPEGICPSCRFHADQMRRLYGTFALLTGGALALWYWLGR